MDRVRVSSSNVLSVGYDRDDRLLEVEFMGGGVYQYRGVPEQVHERFMRSASKGSFLADHIKDRYPTRKVR